MSNRVDRLISLLGKRSDDPAITSFHASEGLEPPPAVFNSNLAYDVGHDDAHYRLMYTAELRRAGTYPPHRENGQYVAYLTSVELDPEFDEPFAGGFTTKLTDAEVRPRALSTIENAFARFYVVYESSAATVTMLFDSDAPHPLDSVRLAATQLDEEDDEAELEQLRAAAPKTQARPRLTSAQLGKAAKEAPPPLVQKLAAISDDEGFGDVDLSISDTWDEGGPAAWTGNPDAANHFRVFGRDGSGGLLAFWLVEAGKPLTEQPIVFLESEGSLGVIARDLGDFVVLLAHGVGPYEIVSYGTTTGEEHETVAALADTQRQPIDVMRDANRAYPDFEAWMDAIRG